MAYGDFKDLARRTYSDKVLRDKAFNIAKSHKYDGYQRHLASMVYKFFDQTPKVSGFNISLESNEELRKPVIKKLKKGTAYSGSKDDIWGAGLADIQLRIWVSRLWNWI